MPKVSTAFQSMDKQSDIEKWIADARVQLSKADQICNDANSYITLTTTQLSSRDDRLPRLIFYMDSTKQQLRLLGIVRDSLDMSINKLFDRKNSLKIKLNKEVANLQKAVAILKDVQVDSAFNEERPTLFYYISEEDLNILLGDVEQNMKQVDELIKNNRTDALLIRMGSDLENLHNEFNALETHFLVHSKLNKEEDKGDPVSRLLSINSELEMDLVSILDSFNRHYDQCIKCSKMVADSTVSLQDKQEFYEVLSNDVKELPQAMAYLQSDRDTVVKNCKEIIKNVGIFQSFFEKVESFIRELTEYGETSLSRQLADFSLVDDRLSDQLAKVDDLRATVVDYTQDYYLFTASYYSLVLEINRREESNRKLEGLIGQFKASLSDVINEDFDKRIDFMTLHGDFLPQNLVSPSVMNNPPPKVEIKLATETLPSLSKESIAEAFKNLK
ncbi:DEKNAAC100159 [Brettanomyces naardenensis]|uniref:Autophagy-related protein 17 n=1 Tax=Brettanomyces naardenensis TaxID=13370 RepID=A0A448YEL9_BRENA|nr:DEKNAAC100159 [Brettanomyces naardenensis]